MIIFYSMSVSSTLQGQTVPVSACLSLTDGLPDITHPVRPPLILNITALTFLFIAAFFLCKPRHLLFSIKSILLDNSMVLSKAAPKQMKGAGHHGTSNLAPRVAFVFSKGLRLLLLKRGRLQHRALTGNIWPLLHRQKIMTKQIRRRQALMAIFCVTTVFKVVMVKTRCLKQKRKNTTPFTM